MLRHVVTVGLAVFLAMSVTGCTDPYESSAEKLVKKTKEMVEAVKGVKTQADATAAAAKLEGIAKDLDEIAADVKKLSKPTDAQKKKVQEVFVKAEKDMKAMTDEQPQAEPAALEKLGPAMMKVVTAMGAVQLAYASQGISVK